MKAEYIVIAFYAVIALILIGLIMKRIKDKKKENFEKRDN